MRAAHALNGDVDKGVATCKACSWVCSPRAVTLTAGKCLAQHMRAKAKQGCELHLEVLASLSGPVKPQKVPKCRAVASLQYSEHPNVHVCNIDVKFLKEVRRVVEGLKSDDSRTLRFPRCNFTFHVEKPPWGKSDIRWISALDELTFNFFRRAWNQLAVAQRLSFLGDLVLLSGYVVVRQFVKKSHFHTDFSETGQSAYTLMTPLYDMSDLSTCHLLGQTAAGVTKQYRYAFGKAIVFGDDFLHATETGEAPHAMAFLCFTLGRRKMGAEAWQNAEGYIAGQCPLYLNPAGCFVKSTHVRI